MPTTQEVKTEYRVCWESKQNRTWIPQSILGWSSDSRPFNCLKEASLRATDLFATGLRRNIRVESRTVTTETDEWAVIMNNPLDELPFPVRCHYPGCDSIPLHNAVEVDEHITEEHLPQAIWTFALEQMRDVNTVGPQ